MMFGIKDGLYCIGKTILQTAMVGGGAYCVYKAIGHKEYNNLYQTDKDRSKHTWIIGQTGVGKSTLLIQSMIQDMELDRNVIFIENHGEPSKDLLGRVPKDEVDKVIYFAPWRTDCYICFNPMKKWGTGDMEKYTIAENLIETFQKIFYGAWGHYTEDIINMSILANLELNEETTLNDVYKILIGSDYREYVIDEIREKNPLVARFWEYEYSKMPKQYIVPPLSKLRKFLARPIVQKVLCQKGKNNLDLYKVMESNHFIADLERDKLTNPVSELIANFLITSFQIATFRRKKSSKFCGIYIDEFQEFVNPSFPVFLSQSRKFNVGITMSHQYVYQLPEEMIKAIRGNVGTYIIFRVGVDDSGYVARVMEDKDVTKFENLADYKCYVRLMKGNTKTPPFLYETIPLAEPNREISGRILENMRNDFQVPPISTLEKYEKQPKVNVGEALKFE